MTDLWNNTCVLIGKDGKVILSNSMLKGHNQAILIIQKMIEEIVNKTNSNIQR